MKLLLLVTIILMASCATVEDQGNQPDYESTKQMMVDMLKTDEGKEAIQEILKDDEVRQELVMDQAFVKETIQQVLTSEQGKEFWEEVMEDPEFAKAFAESIQEQNQILLKSLMKDPEYQEMMMDILQDPEMEEAALDLMKSKEYRQQVMNIMADAFESPYFKARVNEILGKVASEQMEKEAEDDEDEEEDDDEEENGEE
ncbi:spore gernimation protein GerD [Anaerobacillus arseniciselenatis]|uniref:Spore gernimation protein GerD n=2 Tax=Anaerobacillus arseniciselenatis TaxID=85682 RepID=A0A1S2LXZ0_9BACI|nr:spore gernimation protein GerD [Anaerobacillus arseniciselenatis]